MKRILVLYRELAGYFVECLNHLCEKYDVEALVVAYPVHADAPFHFSLSQKIQLLNRKETSLETLISLTSDAKFDLIFCGGWGDGDYIKALKSKKANSLLGFDNQWNGSLKHVVSSIYGRVMIKPWFDYAFVPGEKQKTFARHLGFSSEKIILGAYSCDVPRFSSVYSFRKNSRSGEPKKLIYTGRYADEKFIQPLCSLMKRLREEGKTTWELHCVGKGPLWDQRIEADGIFHHGFMQPELLFEFMKNGSAFILPSTFEPWGVVVHEFAAAGYPMILSTAIGAAEKFLIHNENGYQFESGNVQELEKTMIALFEQSDEHLSSMGQKSAELAAQITPDTWAKSLYGIM